MNTNALKKFAQETRRKLIEQVGSKLEYVLNNETLELREKADQISKLREAIKSTSKEQVIDKVTYTWFNRFMALRFMDANDYQPIGIRVLTPKNGYTLPELLDEAKQGNIPKELAVKNQRIFDLLDGKISSANAQNEAYKELLIGACNHLNKVLPFLFERINDYTELLLPDDLTSELSIVQDICDGMSVEDCAEVEVIGWLYQFYISEKKDEVFASKLAVKKEDIPAATQLFTPRWIVEYMVQNTVGKLWLQNKPNSKLREHMPYFIESPSVASEEYLKINSVEEITLLDQACGSGHILVYGFELLTKIYEEEGYNPNEIPELIITKNLFGFEIDERASQLAGMALMMKARSYNRRFFKKEVEPTILCYKDVVFTKEELMKVLTLTYLDKSSEFQSDLKMLENATNFGSLIIPHSSEEFLKYGLTEIKKSLEKANIFEQNLLERLQLAINQLLLLSKKYHCIVDNPPYMGSGKMNKELSKWVSENYPLSKADLMVCFMNRAQLQVYDKGFVGMINLPSWMFLSSFENYRKELIEEYQIDTLLQLGRGIFGSDFGTVAFTFIKSKSTKLDGICRRLFTKHVDVRSVQKIKKLFLDKDFGYFECNQKDFKNIPGSPIGYWVSKNTFEIFSKSAKLESFTVTSEGIKTGNNERFLRRWNEVDAYNISKTEHFYENKKWDLLHKGGERRKWYGNIENVIFWKKNGELVKSMPNSGIQGVKAFDENAFSWSDITSGGLSFRFKPKFHKIDSKGPSGFVNNTNHLNYTLALLNSKVVENWGVFLNPTISFKVGNVRKIPFIFDEMKFKEIDNLSCDSIKITKFDWDSYETSFDFQQNELIQIKGQDLEETYDLYQQFWKNKFFHLHKNEEELNKQFIEIYGLQDELTPNVALEDITILKEETVIKNGELVFKQTEVFAQFMSYAVGCMFGRYSLDKEGLMLANQGETLEDYLVKVKLSDDKLSFTPDEDNIIPVLDDEWFEDDITGRFYAFLKASFGITNFDKNLAFVEECLGKDVRKYFVKEFYNDHIKRYKKRPIYWMFSSPKGAFNVLIYMHRYTPDTLNKILNNYLIQYREKLNTHLEHLAHLTVSGTSIEQTKAIKETEKLKLVLLELKEYERDILYPLATERINIDLDEGVLVNYNKFGNAIKEVKGLNDKVTKKKVRAFDWIDATTIR